MAQPTRVNGASRVLLLFALAACTATPSAVLELDSSARWLTVKAPPDQSLTVQVGAQAPRVRLAKRDGAARVELAYASGPFVLGAGTVHGSQVDYHDGAVTLRLEANQTGVKEHLFLPAFVADSLLLEWTLVLAPELTARREANGSITLSSQRRPVYQLPTPVLRDANGMVSSAGLNFELIDGRVRLRATGLAARAYPLDLDPTIVTLTADFAAGGNLEGDVDLSSDQLTRARPTSGLGAFAAVNGLLSGRSLHCSVVSNGFLYVLGGDGSAGAVTTVDFAPITGATLGAWAATTPLPTARSQHACVAYDGFIYVLGGVGSALLDEVLVARIGSTGALGAWVSTTALPSARRAHSAVALHGRLFTLGGTTAGAGLLASVDVATFNADGTIGAWSAANPFINARTGHASVGFKDFIYVTGGTTAVGDSAQVQVVRVGPNGALGTWRTVTGLPSTRRQHAAFAAGSALFVTGGSVAATDYSTTVTAVINADGSLGAWGGSALLPSIRHGLSANAFNGVVFIVGGGSTAPLDEVHAASITSTGALGSALGAWVADPAFTSRSYHTSVAANGYLYAIAGQKNAVGITGDVDAARVLGDGTLLPSVPATPLPSPRFIHASAQANGYVYVLGGTFMGAVFNDVLYAHLNLDGSLGAWAATSSFAVPRYALAAVASNGYMYVIAGATDSMTVRSDVQVAAINADGSLGPFTVTSSLPSGRYYFAAVANRGFLYVVAGVGANFTGELAEVLVARQGSNGSLSAWTPTTPMPATRFQHEALAYNGSLYVFGGYRGGFLNEVYQAGFANDGTLGAWAATTPMPVSIYLPRAVASDGIVYVVGGAGGAANEVLRAPLLGPLAVGQYSRLFDLGTSSTFDSIRLNASVSSWGSVSVRYRTAPTSGVFGAPVDLGSIALGTAIPLGLTAQSLWVDLALDDTEGTTMLPSTGSERDVTDITLSFRLGLGGACSTGAECVSGQCIDSFCCNTACGGACDACNLPGSQGTCSPSPAGSPGSPSCAPSVCSGSTAACPVSCTSGAECAAGQSCVMSACVPTPDAGALVDAGMAGDAGAAADGGISADAGGASDAGSTVDAGNGSDAGSASDAGVVSDAGPLGDAGVDGGIQTIRIYGVGCGCGATDAETTAWAGLALAIAAWRRRRAQSGERCLAPGRC